jgi:ABC-type nitrate/sulfonate/bicarbonate transport system permease component
MTQLKKLIKSSWLSIASVTVFLFAWHLFTDATHLIGPNYLPSPLQVIQSSIKWAVNPFAGNTMFGHLLVSLELVVFSFLIAVAIGVPLGIFMGWFSILDRILNPIFQIIRPIPPLAWIPLAIVWFGIGISSKIFVIFLAAFVPSLINTYTGVKTIEPLMLDVAKTFGLKKKNILLKVVVPHSLPYMFAGIRLSLISSWMCLVAAELVAAMAGLGYSIQIARRTLDPPIILVAMILIGLTGMVMIKLAERLEKKLCPWTEKNA